MTILKDKGNKKQSKQTTYNNTKCYGRGKPEPRVKTSPPTTHRENSTKMNSCNTWMAVNPPSLYFSVY